MTIPDKLTVLRAALQICDENNGAASAEAVAARFGVDRDVAVLELLPRIANYFEVTSEGDDGIAMVRQPTANARGFAGP